ncbi:MAG: peroxiredoxin family protein [Bacteroidales bacterium]
MTNRLIIIIVAMTIGILSVSTSLTQAQDSPLPYSSVALNDNLITAEGYRIIMSMPDHKGSFVTLGYHLGDKQYIKDTIPTDNNGRAVMSGSNLLEQGLYMVIFPDNSYFELIIGDDQQFEITCRKSDIINSLSFTGSRENSVFIEYQKGWRDLQEKNGELRRRLGNNSQNADSLEILTAVRSELEKSMVSYLEKYAVEYSGTILSALLKAMIPIRIPDFNIPFDAVNPDSLRWVYSYNYNSEHFFDNISLTDKRLIRTPLLYNKLDTYFNNVLIQHPDTLIRNMHRVIGMAEPETEVYRLTVVYLFNHFRESQIMGHDAIVVELADNYYLNGRAPWAGDEFLKELKKDTDLIRNNIIGIKGADMTMETFDGTWKSLYDLEAEYTIIYFWEPDCGYCKTATPLLRDLYNRLKSSGVEVFAVCTQADREDWVNYIVENELTWVNAWDPTRQTAFHYYYNVSSTPLIYILDSDKKIIAKKLPVESIEDFLSAHARR